MHRLHSNERFSNSLGSLEELTGAEPTIDHLEEPPGLRAAQAAELRLELVARDPLGEAVDVREQVVNMHASPDSQLRGVADSAFRVATTANRMPALFAAMSTKEKPDPPGEESIISLVMPTVRERCASERTVSAALTQKCWDRSVRPWIPMR